MDVPIAANVLGTLGAVCWSVQLIPQIIVNYRRHDTTGLQPTMMLLWATAGIPLGTYNILQSFNIALLIQPQILTFLSLITWIQCKYYGTDTKWSVQKCAAVVTLVSLSMGGLELGLVLGLRHVAERGIRWPLMLMAILAALLLCAGVLRHYWDIYKERTVRGISFMFVGIDAMGDLTSLISVIFQPQLDILGLVIYGSELILWLGVFACGGWFNLRPWVQSRYRRRREINTVNVQRNAASEAPEESSQDRGQQDEQFSIRSSSSSSTVFRTASDRHVESGLPLAMSDNLRLRTQAQTTK